METNTEPKFFDNPHLVIIEDAFNGENSSIKSTSHEIATPPVNESIDTDVTSQNDPSVIRATRESPESMKKSLQDKRARNGNRETWNNHLEFFVSSVSMTVGLGNVWRFPAVAAANGGGAFLIPYIFILFILGWPIYYLEMCMGQFSRYGQVKVWNMAPLFKGIGYGSLIGAICVCSYYCSILGITVHYFVNSFSRELPWTVCHQDHHPNISCKNSTGEYASIYYYHTVFPQLDNIDHGIGKVNWQLALGLIFSWLLIFFSLVNGVRSSGKVAYFTAIFPYVVLIILFIRGVTLSGAWQGIRLCLEPKWNEILKPKVWYVAVEQCFFTLGIGFGSVIMLSSHSSFRSNAYKDALNLCLLDTFTSLLAGVTIFALIGHFMEVNHRRFEEIEGLGGYGLVFILYPQAVASFGWMPQLFSLLFFLMFFTLGIGTATSLSGSIITLICDQFPTWKKWLVTTLVCLVGCLIGLLYVTEGGVMMLDLVDHYGAGFIIYVMVILECAAISYVYGLSNFCNDIEFMLRRRVSVYWKACWGFIIPVGLLGNLLYYLVTEPDFKSAGTYYPKIATLCGWLLTSFVIGMVPVWAIHAVLTRKADTLKEKIILSLKPTFRWGPQNLKLRKEWYEFRAKKHAERAGKGFLIF